MANGSPAEACFDERWLDQLTEVTAILSHGNPKLRDIYLERRLEVRVTKIAGSDHIEECRTEGIAARWRFPNRSLLDAASGVSSATLGDLLARFSDPPVLPSSRPGPPADLDPPRGWREWANEVAAGKHSGPTIVRYLHRQAVVVAPRRWTSVSSPALVRVETTRERTAALLSVWDHPQLNSWIGDLLAAAPAKAWCPTSGWRVPIVFASGTAGVLLHELVGHHVEADVVLSGGSPLSALQGAAITAPTIDVTDDPSRFDLPGGFSSDDEGSAAEPIAVVKSGRLLAWLCDRQGSERLGGAGGRARRPSWYQPPSARLSNLVVPPGRTPPGDLEHELRQGLVVDRLGGASVDPVSNRLLLRVERGWELYHGRRRRALAPFELTGSAIDVLAHIEPTIADDPTPDWRLGWCVKDGAGLPTGSAAPTMMVHHLEVL